jgi:hypothetical protein
VRLLLSFDLIQRRLSLIVVVLHLRKSKREAKTFGQNLSCMLQISWLGWWLMLLWLVCWHPMLVLGDHLCLRGSLDECNMPMELFLAGY